MLFVTIVKKAENCLLILRNCQIHNCMFSDPWFMSINNFEKKKLRCFSSFPVNIASFQFHPIVRHIRLFNQLIIDINKWWNIGRWIWYVNIANGSSICHLPVLRAWLSLFAFYFILLLILLTLDLALLLLILRRVRLCFGDVIMV